MEPSGPPDHPAGERPKAGRDAEGPAKTLARQTTSRKLGLTTQFRDADIQTTEQLNRRAKGHGPRATGHVERWQPPSPMDLAHTTPGPTFATSRTSWPTTHSATQRGQHQLAHPAERLEAGGAEVGR